MSRVKDDTGRPLLDSASEQELYDKICRMLREREPAYEAAANEVLLTDGRTVGEIVHEIIDPFI